MSTLAKVFTIFVIIFSIAQAAVVSTLFYHRTNWRANFESLKRDYVRMTNHKNTMIEAREQKAVTLKQIINDYKTNLATYRSNAINESRINLMLKTSLAQKIQDYEILLETNSKVVTQIEKLEGTIQQLRSRNEDLKLKYTKARNREELAQAQVARLIRIKSDLEGDLSELKKQYLTERKEREALELWRQRVREVYPNVESILADEILTPTIRAQVVAVIKNIEPNLVLLSVGENTKVRKGFKFTIYRGKDFVARVVVEKVLPRFCGARVMFKQKDIQVGDNAATHID